MGQEISNVVNAIVQRIESDYSVYGIKAYSYRADKQPSDPIYVTVADIAYEENTREQVFESQVAAQMTVNLRVTNYMDNDTQVNSLHARDVAGSLWAWTKLLELELEDVNTFNIQPLYMQRVPQTDAYGDPDLNRVAYDVGFTVNFAIGSEIDKQIPEQAQVPEYEQPVKKINILENVI